MRPRAGPSHEAESVIRSLPEREGRQMNRKAFVGFGFGPIQTGLMLCEAMASGKPVIATNLGGTNELMIDGETGVLVHPLDRSRLAEAIKKLVNDRELRETMGRAGRKRIIEGFSMADFKKKMDRVWSSFCDEWKNEDCHLRNQGDSGPLRRL